MINTVWQGFPGYMFAFGIKRLLCIEFRVFRKKEKKKGLEVQKWPREATTRFRVWVATELSGSVSRHGSFCRDMIPKLQVSARS